MWTCPSTGPASGSAATAIRSTDPQESGARTGWKRWAGGDEGFVSCPAFPEQPEVLDAFLLSANFFGFLFLAFPGFASPTGGSGWPEAPETVAKWRSYPMSRA
jgi:hypothetical protein